jgi:hypothetical protein
MKHALLPASLLATLLLSACSKDDDPAAQLPAATQTGANTFGCLLNGQPWTPNGNAGRPNFSVSYDPTYMGGALQVKVSRYTGSNHSLQAITFGAANVKQAGTYHFTLSGGNGVNYDDFSQVSPCSYYGEPPRLTYRTGLLQISRFDPTAGIISGTFSFTLAQPGCDTITATQGRFDKKL